MRYRLTTSAAADIRDIAHYTKRVWGATQARKYATQLLDGMDAMATGQGASQDLSHLCQGLRLARCQHHYILCVFQEGQIPSIIAILHERMDVMARVAGRLA